MSKRKKTTTSKHLPNAKMAARAQRNKQATVKSRKENVLRSAKLSAVPPRKLHDDPKGEAPIIEASAGALPDDISHKMKDCAPTRAAASAISNLPAYQAKLLEITQANVRLAFEFGLRLLAIRSSAEFSALITEFTSRRIEMLGQHWKELAAYPFWRIEPSR
ncbi:Phasin protein [Bradyrhizobium sp. Gha]|uniref:Phasin protein n=1 Tax=Bradyrhizobium sp. Gha TaxID=1855318 RepID=UPI000A4A925F|nr:Phasin protein [Bradyrhizobium sp. Gha]